MPLFPQEATYPFGSVLYLPSYGAIHPLLEVYVLDLLEATSLSAIGAVVAVFAA